MTPQNEFSKRLKNVRAKMKDRGIDVLVIYSAPGNIRFGQRGHVMYISGYEPYFGNTMVVLSRDENLSPLLEIDAANYFPSECTWIKNVKPAGDHVQTLKKYLRETKLEKSRVGVVGEYSMSPSLYARMRREIGQSQIEVASDIFESERAVKSEYEIQCIREASKIAKEGIEAAAKFARAGVSEAEIVGEIERVCRIAGSQGFPHHTMVTSGKDSKHLDWWWYCGKRKLEHGDPWLLDFGTMYNGYCCDISRPFTLGAPSKKQKDVFQVLLQAQEAAQKTAREGVLASEVDKAVSNVLKETWDGDWWGIGHGVGLEVHEWPFIGYQNILDDEAYRDRRLKTNMVISIEPTIYLPEVGDMQIEDQFQVTKTGCKRLNDVPTEIMES
ncbi:MAG: aminopeptidase P family protein [Candidatus Bathyarchaeota archaeon]|nr:MAG: aminopeptidase P family protein [Candidatus Bathyarchaeota archaeon]